jgi:hypothetical protein
MAKKRKSDPDHLLAVRVMDVPVKEVSGICLRREKANRTSLIAVGDRKAELARAAQRLDGETGLEWSIVRLTELPDVNLPEKDPQIEAVCADGAGRVFLLREDPPSVEVIDSEARRGVATILLEVKGNKSLRWAKPGGSRGEGMVLLPGGHLLVAKEKDPAAFIEFGPEGSTPRGLERGGALAGGKGWQMKEGVQQFVALAVWWPHRALEEACADFSDLEIGPDGNLYLLSDKSQSIARIGALVPGGRKASLEKVWRLSELDGKPEGLAFTAAGCALVALDKRKAKKNLVLLEPAIAARGRRG